MTLFYNSSLKFLYFYSDGREVEKKSLFFSSNLNPFCPDPSISVTKLKKRYQLLCFDTAIIVPYERDITKILRRCVARMTSPG